jgi:hypothetical protein
MPIEFIIMLPLSVLGFVCLTKGWIVVVPAKEEGRLDFLLVREVVLPPVEVSGYE